MNVILFAVLWTRMFGLGKISIGYYNCWNEDEFEFHEDLAREQGTWVSWYVRSENLKCVQKVDDVSDELSASERKEKDLNDAGDGEGGWLFDKLPIQVIFMSLIFLFVYKAVTVSHGTGSAYNGSAYNFCECSCRSSCCRVVCSIHRSSVQVVKRRYITVNEAEDNQYYLGGWHYYTRSVDLLMTRLGEDRLLQPFARHYGRRFGY
jgi:hypothetical protein